LSPSSPNHSGAIYNQNNQDPTKTANSTTMPTEAQVAGGHKANLHNPNTSQESKERSKRILDEEFNGGNGA
jgi:hypothetical protein